MRKTHLLLVGVAATVSPLLVSSSLAADEHCSFISPPLRIIDGRRLAIDLPRGWRVLRSAPATDWQTSSYQFEIAPSPDLSSSVTIEILMHGLSRARRHGDLDGNTFHTAGNIHGIETHLVLDHGQESWYLAIPVTGTDSALIVRIVSHGDIRAQKRFAERLFRSIRFVD